MNISRKIGTIVTICVLLVSLLAVGSFYLYSKSALLTLAINDIRTSTEERNDYFKTLVLQANSDLKVLAQFLQSNLSKNHQQNTSNFQFDQRMMQFEDSAWRNRAITFDNHDQVGLFLPSDITLTEDVKHFYSNVMDVFNDFSVDAVTNSLFDNVWMLGHDRSEVIFDQSSKDYIYQMAESTDYTETLWMTLASPELNPKREVKWTPALFEPVLKRWMTSMVYPLDINGQWQATLGIDMDMKGLFSLLKHSENDSLNEQHFILDENNKFILAGPWQTQLEAAPEIFEIDSSEKDLKQLLQTEDVAGVTYLGPVEVKNIEYQAFSYILKPMNWKSIKLIPTQDILKPLLHKMMSSLLLIILMAILLGVLINLAVARVMVRPLIDMTTRARSYALGNKISKLNLASNDEIAELNTAFETMQDDLSSDAEQLLNSQRRYRQVITSINEVLFQIDKEFRWQFLSPVWSKLSGYELQNSLHKPVIDFFHPVDRELILQVITSLLEGGNTSWSGEVRLKHQDGHYIWGNLSLKVTKDLEDNRRAESIVSGTLENTHLIHMSGEVNRLIRHAEQMVLASNNSVEIVLEYITENLVRTLDLPLVWVKVCKDFEGQVLSDAGEIRDFLYDGSHTWSGLHKTGSPVIESVKTHSIIRMQSGDGSLPNEWKTRLEHDEIADSLFIPFYLAGGETHACIGLHSYNKNMFNDDIRALMSDLSSGLRLICQMAEDQNLMRLHRTAVEKTANAIMISNQYGLIEWVNHAFVRMTQYKFSDVQGKTSKLLNSNSESSKQAITEMCREIKEGNVWTGEIDNKRKDGSLMSVYQTVTPLISELGEITHYISVSEDVTERKKNESKIAFMATHDELTELPNRNLLNDRLTHSIAQSKRQRSKMAVLFIDIDHFKYINDSLGHQVGDKLLKMLAKRLSSSLREGDTVARFGGDEFVIVLPEVSSLPAINSLASALLGQIKKPYEIDEHELIITGSIGISIYPDNAATADDLIQHADSAMYSAKDQGRNNCQFYTQKINEAVTRRLVLEKALRQAVELDQLVLHYQPKVDLKTNLITGVEALIRWQHPDLGLISPVEFIPLAEETGVIIEIGGWVLSKACRQMKAWESDFPDLKNMSINVSARQFWQADFMSKVKDVFSNTGVSIEKIEFELTESIVMKDVDIAISVMNKLKSLGVSLSIDDFGTGYSSLSYLHNFPVDVLKIDRSFVNELKDEESDSAIIRSIVALADNFGLQVVAEGIEASHQQNILNHLGCQYGQGYYFSRPVIADEITQLLMEQK